ncbi:MAG: DHHA1 domain-containing protein [Candidatus Pacearchaeota archaeon]
MEKEAKLNKKIEEIREILEKYNNPIYFFDNDVDGLAAFLLLRKWSGKGKAVAIKSFPELNPSYARKISELHGDCVFILDKPRVSNEFLEKAKEQNVRVVWIDHHLDNPGFKEKKDDWIFFNPTLEFSINRPVTYWAYKIIGGQKQYQWLLALGCLADWYLPQEISELYKSYENLFEIKPEKSEKVGKILYETTFGKIILMLNFGLKDTTTNILKLTKFLTEINSPQAILEESNKNKTMHKKFKQIYKRYQNLLEKAKKFAKQDLLWFQYGGSLSISAELSNALIYLYPEKLVVVAYIKDEKARISVRSSTNIREIVLKALEGLEGASGGGHEMALGANVRVEDLPSFRERLEKLWKELKKKVK